MKLNGCFKGIFSVNFFLQLVGTDYGKHPLGICIVDTHFTQIMFLFYCINYFGLSRNKIPLWSLQNVQITALPPSLF